MPFYRLEPLLLKNGSLSYRALNDIVRRQMLDLLHKKGRLPVTTIFQQLKQI